MTFTNIIVKSTQLFDSIWWLTKFFPVFKTNRIDNEMIMQMVSIAMSCNQNFISWPRFFSKLKTNFVNVFSRYFFVWRERLHILIEIHSISFLVTFFCKHKFSKSIFTITINSAYKSSVAVFIINFFILNTVIYDTFHCTDCLFTFFNILKSCHQFLPTSNNNCS